MKNIFCFILLLALTGYSNCYSQKISEKGKEHRLQVKKNSKDLSLKIGDLKTIKKNGNTSWAVKATLINHSCDTLFYFISRGCEPFHYWIMTKVDSIQLYTECGDLHQQTVITIPPSGQRIVDLEILSKYPAPSNFKFVVFFATHKAKNKYEHFSSDENQPSDSDIFVQSNWIKIKAQAVNDGKS